MDCQALLVPKWVMRDIFWHGNLKCFRSLFESAFWAKGLQIVFEFPLFLNHCIRVGYGDIPLSLALYLLCLANVCCGMGALGFRIVQCNVHGILSNGLGFRAWQVHYASRRPSANETVRRRPFYLNA